MLTIGKLCSEKIITTPVNQLIKSWKFLSFLHLVIQVDLEGFLKHETVYLTLKRSVQISCNVHY